MKTKMQKKDKIEKKKLKAKLERYHAKTNRNKNLKIE